jgi:gallate dioxygenase
MARIIGGIGVSHSPTIGFAKDKNQQNDPVWAPIFEAFAPIKDWLREKSPDALFVISNDHVTSFFFDHYSAFTLGIGNQYSVADEGGGQRHVPPIPGHSELAIHIGKSLMSDEFDMSFFQNKTLDHGTFSPMSMFANEDGSWPAPIIPLQVGVLQFPIPSAKRCFNLGLALRKAIESYSEDLKVVIVATGGLSHQVHGERSGFNDTQWDLEFLDLIEKNPQQLTKMTHAEYATKGGFEGSEIIMWLIMRGALSAQIKKIHQTYYLPSMAGIATVIYENLSTELSSSESEKQINQINHQLAGIEQLKGTYPFTLEKSVKTYRLNKFLHDMVYPEHRAAFKENEALSFTQANLTEEEKELVRNRDWRGMIHYGCIFFGLEKLGAVLGISNLHIYAAMRGQSLEEFQKTRNAPNALYSVAATDEEKKDW